VAEALRERGGFPLRPVDARRVEVALAGALAGLDAPELARLRAEAAAHDLASAVELGLVSPTSAGSGRRNTRSSTSSPTRASTSRT
jgi:hypothetical protein